MNFDERVYKITKRIPHGKISTYREIASALNTKAYRAVGQSLKRNEKPIIVPCHRVVKSTGEIGGYAGETEKNSREVRKKIKLLGKEGVEVKNNRIDLKKFLWKP